MDTHARARKYTSIYSSQCANNFQQFDWPERGYYPARSVTCKVLPIVTRRHMRVYGEVCVSMLKLP